MSLGPLDLLKKALFSLQDRALLAEVQKRSQEIDRALQAQDLNLTDDEVRQLDAYPGWTAAVFEALSGSAEEASAHPSLTEAIRTVLADEETQMAEAFAGAIQGLPREFAQWHKLFSPPTVPVPEEYQDQLRRSRVVQMVGESALGLVRYGLSPVSFFEAARGVQLLADRLLAAALEGDAGPWEEETDARREQREVHERREERRSSSRWPAGIELLFEAVRERVVSDRLPPGVGVALETPPPPANRRLIAPVDLVLAAVAGAVYGPAETARPLLGWLLRTSRLRPFLFAGYRARPLGPQAVVLEREEGRTERDLVWRWTREAEPDEAMAEAGPRGRK